MSKKLMGIAFCAAMMLTSALRAQIIAGPIVNPSNGHSYYLLSTATWVSSQAEAKSLGGNLTTIRNASEDTWIFNIFGSYGGVKRDLWIGFYDPTKDSNNQSHSSNFTWVSGEPLTYVDWNAGEPNNFNGNQYYAYMITPAYPSNGVGDDWDGVSPQTPDGSSFFGVAEVVPEPNASIACFAALLFLLVNLRIRPVGRNAALPRSRRYPAG